MGLSRKNRIYEMELGTVLALIPENEWHDLTVNLNHTFQDSLPVFTLVNNHSVTQFFTGKFAVVKRPPVPWAWSRLRDKITMPSKVVYIDVQ